MKKKNLLYSLMALAIIALIAGIISSATEMRPVQKDAQQPRVEPTATPVTSTETPTAVKKKACDCCADRMARLREQIQKARERTQAAQLAETRGVSQQTSERASSLP